MVKYGNVGIDIKNEIMYWNGTTIPKEIASDICLGYERMCTANLLLDKYDEQGLSEEDAMDAADDARERMDDYGLTESEAIDEVNMDNYLPDYAMAYEIEEELTEVLDEQIKKGDITKEKKDEVITNLKDWLKTAKEDDAYVYAPEGADRYAWRYTEIED